MKIFTCPECSNVMDGFPPGRCHCGFTVSMVGSVCQFTNDAPVVTEGDGLKWFGYEQVGTNYEPGFLYNKESDTIGCSQNLANFLGKGKVVLDIGAGLGKSAISFALAGLKVIAADISQVMLEEATQRAKQHNASGIVFARMNGYKLQLANNSVDAVLEVDMLHQVNQPELVMAEIMRVLKPNGFFLQYGGWTTSPYTPEQKAANETYNNAAKDLQDYYDKAIYELGFSGPLFQSWEQAGECKAKNFTLYTTLKDTGCYDSQNLIWTLGMGLHKIKTRAAGAKQLIPDEIHEAAWAKLDAYAKEKYSNNYENMQRHWNSRSGIVVYKKSK